MKTRIIITLVMLWLALPGRGRAAVSPADKDQLLAKAQQLIVTEAPLPTDLKTGIALLTEALPSFPDEIEIQILLAEATYKLADPAANIKQEYPLYEQAGRYAHRVLELDPHRAEGNYWYGLFLLKKAQRSWGLSAYSLAKQGIRFLEKVRAAKPAYDHGGASRVLALLYSTAPGWTPFGDVNKAVRLAEEATRLDPDFALNRLYLANAYKKKGDQTAAAREYRQLLDLTTSAAGIRQEAEKCLAVLDAAS